MLGSQDFLCAQVYRNVTTILGCEDLLGVAIDARGLLCFRHLSQCILHLHLLKLHFLSFRIIE